VAKPQGINKGRTVGKIDGLWNGGSMFKMTAAVSTPGQTYQASEAGAKSCESSGSRVLHKARSVHAAKSFRCGKSALARQAHQVSGCVFFPVNSSRGNAGR